ncbi:MAG: hypothetical protein RL021_1314, partial [Bacteroidota bacterium]
SNGSASVAASGGTPVYTYSWSPGGATTTSLSNLASGAYTVTVTDAADCTQTAIASVSNSGAPSASATQLQPVSCYGGSNGSVTVLATGGAVPYSYNWSNGSTAQSATNLAAGNYNVTVTDAFGCISVATVTVSQPPAIVPVSAVTQVTCYGGANGVISLTTTGGTSPYSYNWSNGGGTNATASGLAAGTYTVTVTDANGCTTTLAANIPQPTPVVPSWTSVPVACNGGSNGSATVNATGGIGPYTYSWSNGSTGAIAVGLAAGSYPATVTDANGCSSTVTVQVGQPTPVVLNTSSQPALCGSSNGSALVIPGGGTPGYSYAWSPSGGSAASASGLSSGQYTVSVTDNAGCVMTASVVVPSIGSPVITASTVTNVSCNGGSDGSAAVLVNSGTAPYTISWPGGNSNDTLTGLAAGSYQVMVTDANGCVSAASVQINQPAPLTCVLSASAVDCNGASTGSVSAQMSGGTPAYSYQWAPLGGIVQNPTGLPAGSYSVVVTDANGCTSASSVAVTEPAPLVLSGSFSPVSCYGYTDGSASVSVTGGTGVYSYAWSPVAGSGSTITALTAGSYSVTLTDAAGCTSSVQVTVPEPPPVTLSITDGSVSCFGAIDGQLQAIASGGNGTFQYAWMPGNLNGSNLNNLPAGIYNLTVTDQNNCTLTGVGTVTEPGPLSLQGSGSPVLCIGQQVTLTASVVGGTQPYTYTWNTGAGGDSITVSPGSSTSYTVAVTDANGCTAEPQVIPVQVYPPLQVQALPLPSICGGDSAYVSATAAGGNGGPYAYSWNNGAILTSGAVIHPLNDSAFVVTVDDGCSPPVQTTVYIDVNPLPDVSFTPQSIIGCTPVRVQFANIFTVPPGSTFQWNLDDNTLSSNSSPAHTYTVPGTYDISLVITTPAGCTSTDTVLQAVEVYGDPVAGFEQSATTVTESSPQVSFYDESSGAVSWFWDFGDGIIEQGVQNPVHHYSDTGTYYVHQIVMNEGGCLDTITSIIRVEPESSIFIPNAFTPNGDNHNEGFIAIGHNIIRYEMWIIDRWGREIYHAVDFQSPWDGTYYSNGNPCQNDVYEYVIDAVDIHGKKSRYIGHVTLVR